MAHRDEDEDESEDELPEAIELPIDGILDLHLFAPGEVKDLVTDYIAECLVRGIVELRIIHGKGRGVLRRTVHALLERHPQVISYRLADESAGGWGATLVTLRPSTADPQS